MGVRQQSLFSSSCKLPSPPPANFLPQQLHHSALQQLSHAPSIAGPAGLWRRYMDSHRCWGRVRYCRRDSCCCRERFAATKAGPPPRQSSNFQWLIGHWMSELQCPGSSLCLRHSQTHTPVMEELIDDFFNPARTQTQLQLDCSLDLNDEAITAHCSLLFAHAHMSKR